MTAPKHPYVPEDHEGKPWCEWTVAILVAASCLLAAFGHETAATAVLAATAIATGVLRLALREKSPWKVRSVAFDATIGIGAGVALLVLFISIRLIGL